MERSTSLPPFRRTVAAGLLVPVLALGLAGLRMRAAGPESPPAEGTAAEKRNPTQEARFPKEALRYGGKSFDQWRTELLTELKPAVRIDGMKALAAFGANGYGAEAAAAVLELMRVHDVESLDEDDTAVVHAAFDALDKIDEAAVPALRHGLKEKSRNVRRCAAEAIRRHPGWAPAAAPELVAALRDSDPYVRGVAARALGCVKPRPKAYLPALLWLLKDQDDEVRNAALNELQQFGPAARAALPILIDLLNNDTKIPNRSAAIRALAALKPDAKTVMPALIRAIQSRDSFVIHDGSGAEHFVYYDAVEAVGTFGPAAAEAVPALVALLKRQIKEYDCSRETTIQALGRVGPAAREAALLIREDLSHWGDPTKDRIEAALRSIEK